MRGAHRLRVPVRVRLRPASSPPKARGLLGHRTARGNAMLYVHASSGNKPRQMSGAFHGAGVVPDSPCSPLRAERAWPVTTAWHPCSLRGTARCTRYRVGDATGNSSDALRVRYGDGRTTSRSCRAHACPHSLIGPAEHAPASCRSARLVQGCHFFLFLFTMRRCVWRVHQGCHCRTPGWSIVRIVAAVCGPLACSRAKTKTGRRRSGPCLEC